MEVSPVGGGKVEIDGISQTTYPISRSYDDGTSVVVVAVPATGYSFDGWSGNLTGTANTIEISMTGDVKITANFIRSSPGVSVIVKGSGSATLVLDDDASAGKATLVATPDGGWYFDRWTGEVDNPESSTTQVSLDKPGTVAANFSRVKHKLTIDINGGGSTKPAVGSNSYAEGDVIALVATADSGWRFDKWTGGVPNYTSDTVMFTITSPKTITANFVKIFPIWLLTLIIIITAVVLIGLAGYYAIHKGYLVIQRKPANNRRGKKAHSKKRKKNIRW